MSLSGTWHFVFLANFQVTVMLLIYGSHHEEQSSSIDISKDLSEHTEDMLILLWLVEEENFVSERLNNFPFCATFYNAIGYSLALHNIWYGPKIINRIITGKLTFPNREENFGKTITYLRTLLIGNTFLKQFFFC